ncbi:MAG: lipopolysaccharide biosynthesis protein [Egibacteraceae bacterium]
MTAAAPVGGPPQTLTARTWSGLRWTYLSSVLSGGMQLIYTASTSRLLGPQAFGLMALAQLTVNFSIYFAQMGVGQALIQKPDLTRDDVRAGFTSSVVLGSLVTAVLWLGAPAIAALFDKPDVVGVVRWLSWTFVLTGFGNTARSLLRRELRFRELAIAETAAYLLGYLVVGLGMAVAGYGVWSLVGAVLSANVFGTAFKYALDRHALVPLVHLDPYRRLYGYGARVSVINFLEYWGNNIDTAAVGRYAATAVLGQYNRAFYLVNLPLTYLTQSLSTVLFSSFSRIQDDRERLGRVYIGVIGVAAALLAPVCIGLGVAAQEVVLVVLGPQWDVAATVVPVLTLAAVWNVLSRFAGIVCEARAELNRKLALQGGYLVLLVGLMALAVGRDLRFYAGALALGELIRHGLYLRLLRRVIGQPVRRQLRAYLPALFTTAVTVAAIALTRLGLSTAGAPVLVVFALELAAGSLALIAAIRLGPVSAMRGELRHRLSSAGVLRRGGGSVSKAAALLVGEPRS